ncbi:MAG: AmmeMemoRadiSam system protein A [Bacteroidales bacterium]
MYLAKSLYTALAMETIVSVVEKKDIGSIESRPIPEALSEKLACFVSIHLTDGSLRGCIGTIEPREENLYHEIITNAISAATKDTRFLPLKKSELDSIEISVDVLSKPVIVDKLDSLDPQKFGVIVSDGAFARGVLLPALEGVETVEKQINIAKRKAGLSDWKTKDLKIYAFTSVRYY